MQLVDELKNGAHGEGISWDLAENSEVSPEDINPTIYTTVTFRTPAPLTLRASPSYMGKPWFDFCFVRADPSEPRAETDPINNALKRSLARVWGFVKLREEGPLMAMITYYEQTKLHASGLHPW